MMRTDDDNPSTDQSFRSQARVIAAAAPQPAGTGFDRRRAGRIAGTVLSVGLFALSLFVLARVVANLNLTDLRAAIVATRAEQIVGASLLAAISYLALTGYDALAIRQLRLQVPYRTTAFGSFTSYAISFTLGFPLVTGGTVRYWIYSRAGLSAGRVASLTIIAGFTFWIGMAAVVATSLLFSSQTLSNLDLLAPWINQLIGGSVFIAIFCYLFWVSRARRRVHFQGFRLELPGVFVTFGQMLLGVTDLCAAAGVLFVLLPAGHGLDFLSFLGLYVFACMLGIASHAPGGIGVFEATMLKFIWGPSEETVIAALLLFRANESLRRWTALREAMSNTRDDDSADEA